MPEPTATYRLQLHGGFGFADARRVVPYLADLGVSHVYLSPVLQAMPGSMHGYDVVEHGRVSADLGGEAALVELAEAAHAHGLGVVVDVVPNHMALAAPEHLNRPLWHVLREGRASSYAHWFDVDWDAGHQRLALPVLGDTLENTVAAGELVVDLLDGEPVLRYHDHVFPLAASTAGEPGADPRDVRRIADGQHYRLACWRAKDHVLNYRRFFDVDSLIGVRVEEPDVFERTHAVLLDLHRRGVVDGFRIDHPDGLADPEGYLADLHDATGGAWVVVEKILEPGETLPRSWRCAGTTGYDALLAVQTSLVDPAARSGLDAAWARTGGTADVAPVAEAAKREAVERLLGPEVDRLAAVAATALDGPDPVRLRAGLAELLAATEVYRAYVRPGTPASPEAVAHLERSRAQACARRPDLADVVDALADLAAQTEPQDPATADFVVRFQQTCGPVMAKGIEDTTFYRWHRLTALNEVGGDPSAVAAASGEALHAWASLQQQVWPHGMTTLSTHDTKRSEDVRARVLAVAQRPDLWEESALPFLEAADETDVDRPTAFLLWQTLLGAWPLSSERLREYLRKAVREAKVHTAWVDGDEEYEQRVLALAERAQRPGPLRAAVESTLAATVADVRATVLSAKLLQLCLPGVPDVYQGSELVTDGLVDPDNRRPVDYARRVRLLARVDSAATDRSHDLDAEKLLVTSRALRLRRVHPDVFGAEGGYTPLDADDEHALGFVRGGRVACVTTRAPGRLASRGGWVTAALRLPEGSWTDVLTGARHAGGELACADVLAELPVALLERR